MRKYHLGIVLAILVIGTLACSTTAVDPTPEVIPTSVPTLASATSAAPVLPAPAQVVDPAVAENVLVQLYERVSPGVVAIQISTDEGTGAGSGFVIDEEGHVITNLHVVEGASELEIDFPSGYKARGEVIGTDPDSDIAVILVDAPP
jgi:S1-C subfamily serine protease